MFNDDLEKLEKRELKENKFGIVQNNDCDDQENYFKIRIGDVLN